MERHKKCLIKKMFEDYKHYLEASRKQNKPFRKNKYDIDRLIY